MAANFRGGQFDEILTVIDKIRRKCTIWRNFRSVPGV